MKNEILELIKNNPKHYVKMIKNNHLMFQWIMDNTLIIDSSLSSNIYSAINHESNICKYGNIKKFKSYSDGFIGCDSANKCNCVRDSVSKKVSSSKSSITSEEKSIINEKRRITTLSKYGVENIGQTDVAIRTRQELYSNKEKVGQITDKVANTKLLKYGDASYNNSEKMKDTYRKKYKVDYWVEQFDNPNLYILNDKAQLSELYTKMNPHDLALHLNVHVQTVYKYLNNHNLREPFKSEPERELERFLNELGIFQYN